MWYIIHTNGTNKIITLILNVKMDKYLLLKINILQSK